MPMPVSVTQIRAQEILGEWSSSITDNSMVTLPEEGVNLMALLRRLEITCPKCFVFGCEFENGCADRVGESGLIDKSGICFEKAIIKRLFLWVEKYLDNAETGIDRIKQTPIFLF
ncbi:hypothetical protein NSTC745_03399 [Nostoc sp. DSM 114161]